MIFLGIWQKISQEFIKESVMNSLRISKNPSKQFFKMASLENPGEVTILEGIKFHSMTVYAHFRTQGPGQGLDVNSSKLCFWKVPFLRTRYFKN